MGECWEVFGGRLRFLRSFLGVIVGGEEGWGRVLCVDNIGS